MQNEQWINVGMTFGEFKHLLVLSVCSDDEVFKEIIDRKLFRLVKAEQAEKEKKTRNCNE